MTLFDELPQGPQGDPLEDSDTQPEKTHRLRTQPFVKRPMRERTGGGAVTFVGARSGFAESQGECEPRTDATTEGAHHD
jgi:hypothetical protein